MIKEYLVPLVEDILSGAGMGIPTTTFKKFYENKRSLLREAILCEVRQGNFSKIPDDDAIAIAYKLYHSTIEGAAKNNLRLMCQVIHGMAEKK